jgi:hypothetical protein
MADYCDIYDRLYELHLWHKISNQLAILFFLKGKENKSTVEVNEVQDTTAMIMFIKKDNRRN